MVLFEEDLLRIKTPLLDEEISKIIAYQESKKNALLVYSPSLVAKSFLLRKKIESLGGDFIYIDFNESASKSVYPAYYLYEELTRKLNEVPHSFKEKFPELGDYKGEDQETYYNFKLGELKRDLYNLEVASPLYIYLDNIDLPFENDSSDTFYRHLLFDKRDLPKNVHVFLVTSNKEQVSLYEEYLEVYKFEVEESNPKEIFKDLMLSYDTEVPQELLDSASESLTLDSYMYIASYLIQFVRNEQVEESLKTFLNKKSLDEVLMSIYIDASLSLSSTAKAVFAQGLLDLYMFPLGLKEEDIVNSGRYLIDECPSDYQELELEQQKAVIYLISFFAYKEGDIYYMSDSNIKEWVGANALWLSNAVNNRYQKRLLEATRYLFDQVDFVTLNGEKCDFVDYLEHINIDEQCEKKNISRFALFYPLSRRLREVILGYAPLLDSSEKGQNVKVDQRFIPYVDKASQCFYTFLDYRSFESILKKPALVYEILNKSKRLMARFISLYIDSYVDYHKKYTFSNISRSMFASHILELVSYIGYKDGKHDRYHQELMNIITEMLNEHHLLIEGPFKDNYDVQIFSPNTSYVLGLNNHEVLKDFVELELAIKKSESEKIKDFYYKGIKEYDRYEDIHLKIVYSLIAFKSGLYLGENKLACKELWEELNPILEDILIYTEYCYFPEVYASIYMYFGRLYPEKYGRMMKYGIHLLKRQGYKDVISPFEKAYNYFSSLEMKGDE